MTATVVACASVATPSPIVKVQPSGLVPTTTDATPDSTCLDVTDSPSTAPETTVNVVGSAQAIVIATFEGYGDAQWNTPDGSPVSGSYANRPVIYMYRPLSIGPAVYLRGDPSKVTGVRAGGGSIGCNRYRYVFQPNLLMGQRYVMFVSSAFDVATSGNPDPWLFWAWPIDDGDVIHSPLDGDLGIAALREIIAHTPAFVPPPRPTD